MDTTTLANAITITASAITVFFILENALGSWKEATTVLVISAALIALIDHATGIITGTPL